MVNLLFGLRKKAFKYTYSNSLVIESNFEKSWRNFAPPYFACKGTAALKKFASGTPAQICVGFFGAGLAEVDLVHGILLGQGVVVRAREAVGEFCDHAALHSPSPDLSKSR